MKESILDVLLYLFEHYFAEDAAPPLGDRDALNNGALFNELTEAGFSAAEIHKAFDWLGVLAEERPAASEARAPAQSTVTSPSALTAFTALAVASRFSSPPVTSPSRRTAIRSPPLL